MASRFGSRFFSFARSGPTIHAGAGPFASSPAFRARFTQQARNGGGHRWNSGGPGAGAAGSEEAQQSFWKRTWNSPIGVRTVHFWYDECYCRGFLIDWFIDWGAMADFWFYFL